MDRLTPASASSSADGGGCGRARAGGGVARQLSPTRLLSIVAFSYESLPTASARTLCDIRSRAPNVERQYRLPQEYGDAPGQLKLSATCAEAGRIRTLARQGVDWTVAEDTRLEAEASARAAVSPAPGWADAGDRTSRLRREEAPRQGRAGTEGSHEVRPSRRDRAASSDQDWNKTGCRTPSSYCPQATGDPDGERHSRDLRLSYETLVKTGRIRDANPSGGRKADEPGFRSSTPGRR